MPASGRGDPEIVLWDGTAFPPEQSLHRSVTTGGFLVTGENRTDRSEFLNPGDVLLDALRLLRSEEQLAKDDRAEEGFETAASPTLEIHFSLKDSDSDVRVQEISTIHGDRPARSALR